MSAPRRWIEEGGNATPFERDLLRSAPSVDPPPGAQSQVLAALLTRLPPPGGAGPSNGAGLSKGAAQAATAKGAAGGATMAAAGGILKGALIGAGSAIALIATYVVVVPAPRSEAPGNPPAALAPQQVAAPQSGAAPRNAQGLPLDGVTGQPVPVPAPPLLSTGGPAGSLSGGSAAGPTADRRAAPGHGGSGPASAGAAPLAEAPAAVPAPTPAAESAIARETMLREENSQMSEARAAMRRGDAPGALTLLEQVRVRFPGGMLVQEREALAIEALARSGRRGDASARAAAFLKAYPTSMFAERVQAFAR